jgi:uncharacterized protein
MRITNRYHFEWDTAKAYANLKKHNVSFDEAMSVFLDPLAMTRFDEEHSVNEERWVTLGHAQNGKLLLIIHTFTATTSDSALIRIISARYPTMREQQQYENG